MTKQTQATVEEIARIIDPHSFIDVPFTDDPALLDMVEQSKDLALRKARRILALPSVGWRTIDSAPKDGRDVLLYYPLDGLSSSWPRAIIGYWRDGHGYWVGQNRAFSGYSKEYQPTHWKPLDAPPQAGEDE